MLNFGLFVKQHHNRQTKAGAVFKRRVCGREKGTLSSEKSNVILMEDVGVGKALHMKGRWCREYL